MLNRKYFAENPSHILGIEISKNDRFGKPIHVTQKNSKDKTINDVLSNIIGLPFVDFNSIDNLSASNIVFHGDTEQISTAVSKIKDGKKNNKGKPQVGESKSEIVSFKESVLLYNKNISRLELEAYLFCYPSENPKLWLDNFQYKKDDFIKSDSTININKNLPAKFRATVTIPTVIYDGEQYHYFAIWLHGDIDKKKRTVEYNSNKIIQEFGSEYYDRLLKGIQSCNFHKVSFDNEKYDERPFVNFFSETAQGFKIKTFIGDTREDQDQISLSTALYQTITDPSNTFYQASKYDGVSSVKLKSVMEGKRLIVNPHEGVPKDDMDERMKAEVEEARVQNLLETNRILKILSNVFSDFIKDFLLPEDKERLVEELSAFYNKFSFTDYNKIPVAFSHNRKFKTSKLKISQAQRDASAFLNVSKCGLLSYDVGVGKTIASILHISNRFDTGNANKALVLVPVDVHKKWYNDIKNHTIEHKNPDTGEVTIKKFNGVVDHINIVDLDNLNDDKLMSLKEFSSSEMTKISEAKEKYNIFKEKISVFIEETEEDEDESQNISEDESKKTKFKKLILDNEKRKEITEIISELPDEVFIPLNTTSKKIKTSNDFLGAFSDLMIQISQKGETPENIEKIYYHFGIDSIAKFNSLKKEDHEAVLLEFIKISARNISTYLISTLGKLQEFPDKTIFLAKESAITRFGFNDETIDFLRSHLLNVLTGSIDDKKEQKKFTLKIEKLFKLSTFNAKVMFNDFGFDYLCIDEAHSMKNLFSKIKVSDTKEEFDEEEQKFKLNKEFFEVKGGTTSITALIGYMISMIVQHNNQNKNVCLLTATPFTNSPLEIYSMLMLLNYRNLVQNGYESVKRFVLDFIDFQALVSVNLRNQIEVKAEPVGFNNLQLLRRIVYSSIYYQTGDQSKVKRPCKIVLPLAEKTTVCDTHKSVTFKSLRPINTIVTPEYEQSLLMRAIEIFASEGEGGIDKKFDAYIDKQNDAFKLKMRFFDTINEYNDFQAKALRISDLMTEEFINRYIRMQQQKGKKVQKEYPKQLRTLKSLLSMRIAGLSPYLFRPYLKYLNINPADITSKMVVETSSKMMYVLGCIRKFNEYQDQNKLPRKGFVLYTSIGINETELVSASFVKMLKDYLMNPDNGFGYKEKVYSKNTGKNFDEVELLIGSGRGQSRVRKNNVISAYNEGTIKIVITSLSQGIDLNADTISLFNLAVDWNPTDAKQVEGRAWRQGNQNAYCVISYPLLANSADLAYYQKLQLKTERLAKIWDNEDEKSQFDLGEFNPEKLKEDMLSSVDKLAVFLCNSELGELKIKFDLAKLRYDEDLKIINDYDEFYTTINNTRKLFYWLTKIPVLLEKQLNVKEWNDEIESEKKAIASATETIEEEKQKVQGAIESSFNTKISHKKSEIQSIKEKISEISIAKLDEDNEKKIKALDDQLRELSNKNKEITKDIEKIEKEKEAALKETEKNKSEDWIDAEKTKKESENIIKDLQKKIEKALSEKITGDDETELKHDISAIKEGNYFELSESKNIRYKEGVKGIDQINWLTKATYFDLFEGIDRITRAYLSDATYDRILRLYSIKFEFPRKVNISELCDQFGDEKLKENLMAIFNEMRSLDESGDLPITLVGYDDDDNVDELYDTDRLSKLANYHPSKQMQGFSLAYADFNKRSYQAALLKYKATIGEQTPEEHIADLKKVYDEYREKFGESEEIDLNKLSDKVINDYLEKAYDIVKERNKQYGNFTQLVHDFDSLSEKILNVPFSVIEKDMDADEQVQYFDVTPEEIEEENRREQAELEAEQLKLQAEKEAADARKKATVEEKERIKAERQAEKERIKKEKYSKSKKGIQEKIDMYEGFIAYSEMMLEDSDTQDKKDMYEGFIAYSEMMIEELKESHKMADGGEIEKNEEQLYEMQEDDCVINASPSDKYSVSCSGKHIGYYESVNECLAAIKSWQEKNNWYPTIWYVSDHGNYWPINSEGKEIKLAKGGEIHGGENGGKNQWKKWTISQRKHFLYDHKEQIGNLYYGSEMEGKKVGFLNIINDSHKKWEELDEEIKMVINDHLSEGKYAKGGEIYGWKVFPLGKRWQIGYVNEEGISEYRGSYGTKEEAEHAASYENIHISDKFAKGGEIHSGDYQLTRSASGDKWLVKDWDGVVVHSSENKAEAIDWIEENKYKDGGKVKGNCPEDGCVQPHPDHKGKWGIVSNKTGKFWNAVYDTKASAEGGLAAYHVHKKEDGGNIDDMEIVETYKDIKIAKHPVEPGKFAVIFKDKLRKSKSGKVIAYSDAQSIKNQNDRYENILKNRKK